MGPSTGGAYLSMLAVFSTQGASWPLLTCSKQSWGDPFQVVHQAIGHRHSCTKSRCSRANHRSEPGGPNIRTAPPPPPARIKPVSTAARVARTGLLSSPHGMSSLHQPGPMITHNNVVTYLSKSSVLHKHRRIASPGVIRPSSLAPLLTKTSHLP